MNQNNALMLAMRRIFRPLSKLSMARGLTYQDVQKILKQAFVDTAERDFQIDGKRLTESRISLLTGLQRRDIKQITQNEALPSQKTSPLHRLHSQLLALDNDEISYDEFDALARSFYQDVHPRTFLNEFERLGLVKLNDGKITIEQKSLIDDRDENAMTIFADNLSAHARSAVSNLLGETPELEQAVFATHLTPEDSQALQNRARELSKCWLLELNAMAISLQNARKGNQEVRIGIYFNQTKVDECKD